MPLDPIRVKALFQAALDLPDTADRPAFLDRECDDDRDLRLRLDELLAAHDQPASALNQGFAATTDHDPTGPPIDDGDQTASYRPASAPIVGTVIADRYRIRQEIGEGGMGSVYLAEQTQPVKRLVALKLIKPGMDSRTVLARFEQERQALALMDHPNIAKVLDAGTTEQGRPFFVMELVKGIPLTDYCDQHRLGLPAHLDLFRQICSAVQHAHQKGIIHRDLKPQNILVETHDEKPVPKVIDFGLAKATGGLQLSDLSLQSAFGGVAGTPLYMAPEQATFNAIDIDTRADIYALGVVLYELLTGSTPIPREVLTRASLDEMLRMVREVEPPPPSSRISSLDTLPNVAAARHIEPARLGGFLRGDLDWIVMKALAKERNRRYESPLALAQDIERFLNHEPVTAGPPSAFYRFRKFARRHRPQVIAASLVLLTLLFGIAGTTYGLIEARSQKEVAVKEAVAKGKALIAEAKERKLAEDRLAQVQKANEILGSIFRDLDLRSATKGRKPLIVLLGERLDQATAQIEGEAIGDALTVAAMQQYLGVAQHSLGNTDKAIALYTRSVATFRDRLGADHPSTIGARANLAAAYQAAGKTDLALPILEETLKVRKSTLGLDHPNTQISMNNLAGAYMAAGQVDRALPLCEQALALRKARLGPNHLETLNSMSNLAEAYRVAGRLDKAESLLVETLALQKANLHADNPDILTSMNNLAAIYRDRRKFDEAIAMSEQTLELMKSTLGPEHPNTLVGMNNLALGLHSVGKLDRALPLYEQAVPLMKAKLGPEHPTTLTAQGNLAIVYRSLGKFDRAVPLLEEALALKKSRLGQDHPETIKAQGNLAATYLRAKRPEDALRTYNEFIPAERRRRGADSIEFAVVLVQVSVDLQRSKLFSAAEPLLRESLAILEKREPDVWTTFDAKSMLGAALLGQKKTTEAKLLLRAGYEGMKDRADKIPPEIRNVRLGEALDRLIALAEATGKPDDAKAWKEERAKLTIDAAPRPPEAR